MPLRSSSLRPWLLRVSLTLLALITLRQWAVHPGLEGDTESVVRGAQHLLACGLRTPCEGASHYPLFQYLLAMPLLKVGLSAHATLKALAAVSLAAWAALFYGFRKQPLGGAVLFTGPLWVYATSSFGEMVAALLIARFVHAALARQNRGLLLYGFLAGITKEVAWPFLLVTGAWILHQDLKKNPRVHLPALLGGLLAAVTANSLFNYWRFGSIQNLFLLQARFQVPDLATHASFTAGLWLSPNGGLLLFWPAFAILLGLCLAQRRPSGYAVLGLLAALTLGLGKWFAPMGWLAWGPRLVLPWVPAWTMLLLSDPPRLPSRGRIAAVALSVGVGLAHVTSLLSFVPKDSIFGATPECPNPAVSIEATPDAYYACIRHLTWPTHSFGLLNAWREIGARPLHVLVALAFVAAAWAYSSRVRTER